MRPPTAFARRRGTCHQHRVSGANDRPFPITICPPSVLQPRSTTMLRAYYFEAVVLVALGLFLAAVTNMAVLP
jgi:hypothetical protein